jgi:hypothetical protein
MFFDNKEEIFPFFFNTSLPVSYTLCGVAVFFLALFLFIRSRQLENELTSANFKELNTIIKIGSFLLLIFTPTYYMERGYFISPISSSEFLKSAYYQSLTLDEQGYVNRKLISVGKPSEIKSKDVDLKDDNLTNNEKFLLKTTFTLGDLDNVITEVKQYRNITQYYFYLSPMP